MKLNKSIEVLESNAVFNLSYSEKSNLDHFYLPLNPTFFYSVAAVMSLSFSQL
jgi:hypothetical protein